MFTLDQIGGIVLKRAYSAYIKVKHLGAANFFIHQ